MAADLRRHLRSEPISAHPTSAWYRLSKFSRRNRGLVTGLMSAALIFVIGSIISTSLALHNAELAREARRSEDGARRTAYRTGIVASVAARENHDLLRIEEYLVDAPEELKGWEWAFLRELSRPQLLARPTPHLAVPTFHHEGDLLAAIQGESGLDIIEVSSGRVRSSLEGFEGFRQVLLTSAGKRVIGFHPETGRLEVWDTSTERCLLRTTIESRFQPRDDSPEVRSNATGTLVAVDGGPVIEVDSGATLYTLEGRAVDLRGGRLLEWNPVGFWGTEYIPWIRLIDVPSGEVLASFEPGAGKANGAAWSPSGRRIAIRSQFGATFILDAQLEPITELRTGDEGAEGALVFVDDRTLLERASGSSLQLWDLETRTKQWRVSTQEPAERLVVSPNGEVIAACSRTELELLAATPRPLVLKGHSGYVYSAAFSEDGSLLASAAWDGTVRVWDLSSGDSIATLRLENSPNDDDPERARGIAFFPDGTLLIDRPESLERWDFATGVRTKLIDRADPSYSPHAFLEFAPSGSKYWRNRSGERYATSFDGSWQARGQWGKSSEIELYRREPCGTKWQTTPTRSLPGHFRGTTSIAFHPNGLHLASGGKEDGLIQLWDLEEQRKVAELAGHEGSILCAHQRPPPSGPSTSSADGAGT